MRVKNKTPLYMNVIVERRHCMGYKSKRRTGMLNSISEALKSPDIYGVIDYRNQKEDKIKQFIYPTLLKSVTHIYESVYGCKNGTAESKAKKSLLWEGNVKTTVPNMLFMGTQHRPDMAVEFKKFNVAVEIKRGDKGVSLRESIGQSIVYSTTYDFVVSLFIDISKDKKIVNSSTSKEERRLINNLWQDYNIKFEVI